MKNLNLKSMIPSVLLLSNATVAKAYEEVNKEEVLRYLSTLMPFHGELLVASSPRSPYDTPIALCEISLTDDQKFLQIDRHLIPLKKSKFFLSEDSFIIEYARSEYGRDLVQIRRAPDAQGHVVITYNWNSKIFKYCRKTTP